MRRLINVEAHRPQAKQLTAIWFGDEILGAIVRPNCAVGFGFLLVHNNGQLHVTKVLYAGSFWRMKDLIPFTGPRVHLN